MKNILAFLFGDSQIESEIDEAKDAIEHIFEEVENDPLRTKKTPLASALKALGIAQSDEVTLGDGGFYLTYDQEADYKDACRKLTEPDGLEKLAEMGWFALRQGDRAMSGEVQPEYRIRFVDITTPDPENETNWPAPNPKLVADILKKGREFATTPLERDPHNPVTDLEPKNDKHAGMGKEREGSNPEGKLKGSAQDEAKETCRIKDCRGKVVAGAREKYGPGFQGLCQDHIASQQERGAKTGRHHATIRRIYGDTSEALGLVDQLLSPVSEGGKTQKETQRLPNWSSAPLLERHKPGCTCGFCKNKGRFGRKPAEPEAQADTKAQEPPGALETDESLARRKGRPKRAVKSAPVAPQPRTAKKIGSAFKTPRK